jgi:hypothetical protein
MRAAMTDDLRLSLAQAGYEEEEFLRTAYTLIYAVVAIVTIAYQGCMTVYYTRRRSAVIAALDSGVAQTDAAGNES